ncbi:MAG: glycoside hydrolase family 3 C-terminal domain-containing protein [Cytophagaceae bacterium]|jgi:beta-glucosidase|nr:glycoside hydrolase family 3 C-terminal domain-containing protein [Cytophagaceae bacterium]
MKKTILIFLGTAVLNVYPAIAQKKDSNKLIYKNGWIDFNKNGVKDVYEDPAQPIEKRIANLLSQMNIDEKTCQMATVYGYGRVLSDSLPTANWKNEIWKDGIANIDEMLNGVGKSLRTTPHLLYPFSNHAEAINTIQRWFIEETRLGIPVDFSNEGIHGLNHTKATPLPAPIAIGSTWNKALIYEAGSIVGKEAKALGYTNVYAPILDVARDPRWGRVLECYGEDPFLIAELGIQMTKGIQEQGVASTLKHYAVYSVPKGGRDGDARTDPHVAPREMHEMHLYPFRRVIQEAHPMGIMASYNDYDGIPIIASDYFMTELLRRQYGFTGYSVSDSWAVEYVETKHHTADTGEEAVRQVVEAGLNVRTSFTPALDYILPLRKLIEDKKVSMATIDRLVGDVLRVKFQLKLFDNPYVADAKIADKIAGEDKHIDFVYRIQHESLILLKNEGNLLPLDKTKLKRILVTGPLAAETNFMISRYGPNQLTEHTILEGLQNYLGNSCEALYTKGCDVVDSGFPATEIFPTPMTEKEIADIQAAVDMAKDCDMIIVALGEDERRTGESKSRTSLDLPGRQQQLLEALYATGKPVVLILVNGRPLTINWADKYIPSIVETWFPTNHIGTVLAKTLFGDYNPGGKLTVTFPRTIGQLEYNFPFKPGSHAGQPGQNDPNGFGNTRINGALYPFGHGLSYTTFSYSDLVVMPEQQRSQGEFTVTCKITNTGNRKGDEVVQLYVNDKVSSVITYESVLRGFERISLNAGETKEVKFVLKPSHLELLDRNMNRVVEHGEFDIMIGASSEDIRLKKTISVLSN